jgi:hypothetical protein
LFLFHFPIEFPATSLNFFFSSIKRKCHSAREKLKKVQGAYAMSKKERHIVLSINDNVHPQKRGDVKVNLKKNTQKEVVLLIRPTNAAERLRSEMMETNINQLQM